MTRQKRYTLCVIYDQLHGQFHRKHSNTHANGFCLHGQKTERQIDPHTHTHTAQLLVPHGGREKFLCWCQHTKTETAPAMDLEWVESNQFGSIKWRKTHKSYEHFRTCDCFDFCKCDGKPKTKKKLCQYTYEYVLFMCVFHLLACLFSRSFVQSLTCSLVSVIILLIFIYERRINK